MTIPELWIRELEGIVGARDLILDSGQLANYAGDEFPLPGLGTNGAYERCRCSRFTDDRKPNMELTFVPLPTVKCEQRRGSN